MTETTGAVTLNYGYNANGSLTTKHEGSVLQSEQAWDVRGRLAGLKDGSGNWLSQYRYTPDGIRSAVTEGGTTTLHVIDVLGPSGYAQVIEERTAAGVVVGSYVYGPALDPLSQWRDGHGANLYLADGHSGVRQAVSLAGVVLLAQRFDAFGVTVATAGTLANVIGYRGERFDSTLGQYYLRARFYNPMSGRFSAMDPFAGNYGDPLQAMRYGYAGANPVMNSDPSGMFFTGLVIGLAWRGTLSGSSAFFIGLAAFTLDMAMISWIIRSQLSSGVASDNANARFQKVESVVRTATINFEYSTGDRSLSVAGKAPINRDITPNIQRNIKRMMVRSLQQIDPKISDSSLVITFTRVPKSQIEQQSRYGRQSNGVWRIGFHDQLQENSDILSNRHFGQTGMNTFSYSAAGIRDHIEANSSIDYAQAVSFTITHEASLHIIGGIDGHFEDRPGAIDSEGADPTLLQFGSQAVLSREASLRFARGLSLVRGE